MSSTSNQRDPVPGSLRLTFITLSWVFLLQCMAFGQTTQAESPHIGLGLNQRRVQLPQTQPKVLWKYRSDENRDEVGPGEMPGVSDSVLAFGNIFFGDESGRITALNAIDGSLVWQSEGPQPGTSFGRITARPAVDEDHVYFTASSGFGAINRQTGELVWQQHPGIIPGAIIRGENGQQIQNDGTKAGETGPILAGHFVYTAAYDGCAYGLDRLTGEIVWSTECVSDAPKDPPGFDGERARFQDIPARPRGSAVDADMYYLGIFDQCRIVAMDRMTGEKRWSYQTQGWVGPSPTLTEDRVYISSQDDHLHCVDRMTGNEIWKFKTASWVSSQSTVRDGKAYLPGNGGFLYCLNAANGQEEWTFRMDEDERKTKSYSAPIVTEQLVCFAAGNGFVYAIDRETGQLMWKLLPSEGSELYTSPSTDGSRIFVSCRQKRNYAKTGNADDTFTGECAVIAIGE